MEHDDKLVLALLAVQLKGGQAVPATDEPIKTVKKWFKAATENGLLEKTKVKVATTTKTGRASTRQVEAYTLTEGGRQYLAEITGGAAGRAGEAGLLAALRQEIEEDRARLHAAVGAALVVKDGDRFEAELRGMARRVMEVAEGLQRLDEAARPADVAAVERLIDESVGALAARVGRVLQGLSSAGPGGGARDNE